MIEIVPLSPFSQLWAAALLIVCAFAVWQDRKAVPLVAVMAANWLATRAVSAFDLAGAVQAVADLISAALLLAMWRGRFAATIPVASLFALMVFISGIHDAGLIARDTMWAWADVLGYCQLLIIAGSAVRGGGHPRLAMAPHRRGRDRAVVAAVARRLQDPPPS